jgi:hypothetical protein
MDDSELVCPVKLTSEFYCKSWGVVDWSAQASRLPNYSHATLILTFPPQRVNRTPAVSDEEPMESPDLLPFVI